MFSPTQQINDTLETILESILDVRTTNAQRLQAEDSLKVMITTQTAPVIDTLNTMLRTHPNPHRRMQCALYLRRVPALVGNTFRFSRSQMDDIINVTVAEDTPMHVSRNLASLVLYGKYEASLGVPCVGLVIDDLVRRLQLALQANNTNVCVKVLHLLQHLLGSDNLVAQFWPSTRAPPDDLFNVLVKCMKMNMKDITLLGITITQKFVAHSESNLSDVARTSLIDELLNAVHAMLKVEDEDSLESVFCLLAQGSDLYQPVPLMELCLTVLRTKAPMNVKRPCVDIVVEVLQEHGTVVKRNMDLFKRVFDVALQMTACFDDFDLEAWCENCDTDMANDGSESAAGSELMDYLALCVKGKVLGPLVLDAVKVGATDRQWEVRAAAMRILGVVAEGCAANFSKKLPTLEFVILPRLKDTEPVVRGLTVEALAMMMDDIEFPAPMLRTFLGELRRLIQEDTVPRVQATAMAAFANFTSKVSDSDFKSYSGPLLELVEYVLLSNLCDGVKVQCVKSLSWILTRMTDLDPRVLQTMVEGLSKIIFNGEVTETLRWQALEAIAQLAATVKDNFPYSGPVCELLAQQTMEVENGKVTNIEFIRILHVAWGNMGSFMGIAFYQYLPILLRFLHNYATPRPNEFLTNLAEGGEDDGELIDPNVLSYKLNLETLETVEFAWRCLAMVVSNPRIQKDEVTMEFWHPIDALVIEGLQNVLITCGADATRGVVWDTLLALVLRTAPLSGPLTNAMKESLVQFFDNQDVTADEDMPLVPACMEFTTKLFERCPLNNMECQVLASKCLNYVQKMWSKAYVLHESCGEDEDAQDEADKARFYVSDILEACAALLKNNPIVIPEFRGLILDHMQSYLAHPTLSVCTLIGYAMFLRSIPPGTPYGEFLGKTLLQGLSPSHVYSDTVANERVQACLYGVAFMGNVANHLTPKAVAALLHYAADFMPPSFSTEGKKPRSAKPPMTEERVQYIHDNIISSLVRLLVYVEDPGLVDKMVTVIVTLLPEMQWDVDEIGIVRAAIPRLVELNRPVLGPHVRRLHEAYVQKWGN